MTSNTAKAEGYIRDDAPEATTIEENPFAVLGATTRDDRKRIVELAEEKSFTGNPDQCSKARSDLTNPRNRLAAELGWLPGVSPKRASEMLALLKTNPRELRNRKDSISPLALANLYSSVLQLLDEDLETQEWVSWIIDFAGSTERIDPAALLRDINEDRSLSAFPEIKSVDQLDGDLNERSRAYRDSIKHALDRLPPLKLLDIVTQAVEAATDSGKKHGPALIDDMADTYTLHTQAFLRAEADKIIAAVEATEATLDKGKSAVNASLKTIEQLVLHFHKFAKPIQQSMKSRGLPDELSNSVAIKIRGLSFQLVGKYDNLEAATEITKILKAGFTELPVMAELLEKDTSTLEQMTTDKEMLGKIGPVRALCDEAYKAINEKPDTGEWQGQRVLRESKRLIEEMRVTGVSGDVIKGAENYVAKTLFQCAINFGNATEKWLPSLKLMEAAKSLCTETEFLARIDENLETVRGNIGVFGGFGKVSPPSMFTLNGFGFMLYGDTDHHAETNSHIATYYFTAFFVPLFPISRYRVIKNGNSYRFLGKYPLRVFDKWHLGIVAGIIAIVLLNAK